MIFCLGRVEGLITMEEKSIHEINDKSGPSVIEHFVGQENVKALVKTALEASWQDGSVFPNTVALGDAGLGKTAISNLIAKETASTCHEVLAGSFKNVSDLHGFPHAVPGGNANANRSTPPGPASTWPPSPPARPVSPAACPRPLFSPW